MLGLTRLVFSLSCSECNALARIIYSAVEQGDEQLFTYDLYHGELSTEAVVVLEVYHKSFK